MLYAIRPSRPLGRGVTCAPGCLGPLWGSRSWISPAARSPSPRETETSRSPSTARSSITSSCARSSRPAASASGRAPTREVLLRLWIERGEACLEALNGDFAFAIHDRRQATCSSLRATGWACARCSGPSGGERVLFRLRGEGAPRRAGDPRRGPIRWASPTLRPCGSRFPRARPFAGVNELPPGHLLIARAGRGRDPRLVAAGLIPISPRTPPTGATRATSARSFAP